MNILGINAKLGDGCLAKNGKNYYAHYSSVNAQWLTFKRDLAIMKGMKVSAITPAYSGYRDKMSMWQFRISNREDLTEVAETERIEILKTLSKMDLILWYIDDGSWHKTRRTMHLYCNSLEWLELNVLQDRFVDLYGIRPTISQDRKKDGRSYPYFYFPRKLVIPFRRDVRRFLKYFELDTMYYKVGETSETIRKE